MSTVSGARVDRAAGVLLATACGDALGAGYEFGPPLPAHAPISMSGGGGFGWEPGEWTDDTSMAIAIAEVTAHGGDLRTSAALDGVVARWVAWSGEAKDVGNQTRAVLNEVRHGPTAEAATAAATALHARTGRSGGNGSLMRTAPVALAYLDDPGGLVEAAQTVSGLTHHDPQAGEACALWCLAIRHAVLHGTFDGLRHGLAHLPGDRAALWAGRLDEAEGNPPEHFEHNGWVVHALQGAWSAIHHTPIPAADPAAGVFPAQHLQHALEAAVRGGHDTDTVAAIAGSLLGARWGASAVPAAWRRILRGWPDLRARDLIHLGVLTARHGHTDAQGWPTVKEVGNTGCDGSALAVHPHDPGVLLGGVDALRQLPDGIDAVISLCRLGRGEAPARVGGDPDNRLAPEDHLEVWLIDQPDSAVNPHLDFVLHDTARALAALRAEGHTVLVHCVQAQSRTPAVAIAHAVLNLGVPLERATGSVRAVLPAANPNPGFTAALARLAQPPSERSRSMTAR